MKKRYIVQRPDELRGAYPQAILALTQAMVCKLQKRQRWFWQTK